MSPASKPVRPLRDFLHVLVAPTIWFAHFSIVYGAEALICRGSQAAGDTAMTWTILLASGAALAGLCAYAVLMLSPDNASDRARNHDRIKFLPGISLILVLLSSWSVVWTTFPILFLTACAVPAG